MLVAIAHLDERIDRRRDAQPRRGVESATLPLPVLNTEQRLVFFDFSETYTKLATELLRTHKWSPTKSFAGDSLAVSTLGQGGGALVEGLRGVAPGAPRTGPAATGFRRLYAAGGAPRYTQPFNAQAFDATMLCYLSAVAAGSTSGSRMAHEVRQISAPPGEKLTWLQLPEASRALESGKDIDYQGASGPIDMDQVGNPTAGYYDVYKFQNARLATYGLVSVPAMVPPSPALLAARVRIHGSSSCRRASSTLPSGLPTVEIGSSSTSLAMDRPSRRSPTESSVSTACARTSASPARAA